MPKGPQGQKRPADVIGAAIRVARIATGEETEELKPKSGRVRSGKAGSLARAARLSPDDRDGVGVSGRGVWRNSRRDGAGTTRRFHCASSTPT
jgi:hypothetical protein